MAGGAGPYNLLQYGLQARLSYARFAYTFNCAPATNNEAERVRLPFFLLEIDSCFLWLGQEIK